MTIDMHNAIKMMDIMDSRIFCLDEAYFTEDVCYGEISSDDVEVFSDFGAEKRGEYDWWIPANLRFCIKNSSPSKYCMFYAKRGQLEIPFMHLDCITMEVPLTNLGIKCQRVSKIAENKDFADVVKDILFYMDNGFIINNE